MNGEHRRQAMITWHGSLESIVFGEASGDLFRTGGDFGAALRCPRPDFDRGVVEPV
jgi:hypothetical protein